MLSLILLGAIICSLIELSKFEKELEIRSKKLKDSLYLYDIIDYIDNIKYLEETVVNSSFKLENRINSKQYITSFLDKIGSSGDIQIDKKGMSDEANILSLNIKFLNKFETSEKIDEFIEYLHYSLAPIVFINNITIKNIEKSKEQFLDLKLDLTLKQPYARKMEVVNENNK